MTKQTTATATLSKSIAQDNITAYITLQAQKAKIDAQMKAHKALLLKYAKENRDAFDDDGNLTITEEGYLHFGKKTVVKTSPKFDLLRFVKFFPELLKREFKVAAIKAIMADSKGKIKLKPHGITLTEVDEFTIKSKIVNDDNE